MCKAIIAAVALVFVALPAVAKDVSVELRALKKEPTVREVQEATLRYFHVNMEKLDSMRTGASYKALLPVVELSGGFVQSDVGDEEVNQEWHPQDVYIFRSVDAWAWEVRGKATWDLPRLIFNAEELDVASLAGLMEGILKESTRLFYMRRRLQVDMLLTPPKDQATRLTKQLRLEELTGLIDAMTGGWFQIELDRRGVNDRPPVVGPSTKPQPDVSNARPSAPAPRAPAPKESDRLAARAKRADPKPLPKRGGGGSTRSSSIRPGPRL